MILNKVSGGGQKVKIDGQTPPGKLNLKKEKIWKRISAFPTHPSVKDIHYSYTKCRPFSFDDKIYAVNQVLYERVTYPQFLKLENDSWVSVKEHGLIYNQLECGNVNGEAYAICTAVDRNKNPCVYKFNPIEETFKKISEYETPDYALKATSITGNKIYAIVENSNGNDDLVEFNLDTNRWTIKSKNIPLEYNQYGAKLINFKKELHLLCSEGSGGAKNHHKYDGEVWTKLPTLPEFFMYCNAFSTNEKIYAIGTRIASNNWGDQYGKVYEYNGEVWTLIPNFPLKNGDFRTGCLVKDDNILLLGVGQECTCIKQETIYTEEREV